MKFLRTKISDHRSEWMRSYEQKFENFIRMCQDAKRNRVDVVLVPFPQTLGDTYEEIVESLNRIADAKLRLGIAGRGKAHDPGTTRFIRRAVPIRLPDPDNGGGSNAKG